MLTGVLELDECLLDSITISIMSRLIALRLHDMSSNRYGSKASDDEVRLVVNDCLTRAHQSRCALREIVLNAKDVEP